MIQIINMSEDDIMNIVSIFNIDLQDIKYFKALIDDNFQHEKSSSDDIVDKLR